MPNHCRKLQISAQQLLDILGKLLSLICMLIAGYFIVILKYLATLSL